MPKTDKRNYSLEDVKKMSPEERDKAANLIEFGTEDIFKDREEDYLEIYNSFFGTNYKELNKENDQLWNSNIRSLLYMYLMTEKGLEPEALTEMEVEDFREHLPEFKEAIKEHPIYGEAAEKLTKEQLEENIKWYGKMIGTSYKSITDEKFPNNEQYYSDSGIALANHKNFCTFDFVLNDIADNSLINIAKLPKIEGITGDSAKKTYLEAVNEAAGEKNTEPGKNTVFDKANRAGDISVLMGNIIDSSLSLQQRAFNKIMFEADIKPYINSRDVSFDEKLIEGRYDISTSARHYYNLKLDEKDKFSKMSDEECKEILTHNLNYIRDNEPKFFQKMLDAAEEKLPRISSKVKDKRQNGLGRILRTRLRSINEKLMTEEEYNKKVENHRNETYNVFAVLNEKGHEKAGKAEFLQKKDDNLDCKATNYHDILINADAFDEIFADAKDQQREIITKYLIANGKGDPSEKEIEEEFYKGFYVKDPESGGGYIPVADAVKKYVKMTEDTHKAAHISRNEADYAKALVMLEIGKQKPIDYDPLVYKEIGKGRGKIGRAKEDQLETVKFSVFTPKKLKIETVQDAINRNKERNIKNIEEHKRAKKTAEDYEKIAAKIREQEEEYEDQYQRDLAKMTDERELRKRKAIEAVRAKKAEKNLTEQEKELIEIVNYKAPEPKEPDPQEEYEEEERIFKEAEEAFKLMERQEKELENKFREGNKFCIDTLSDETKKMYDIMEDDREGLKAALEAAKAKSNKKGKQIPEGKEETYGTDNKIFSDLKNNTKGLDTNRWYSWLGFGVFKLGVSHELAKLKHQMERVQKVCELTSERGFEKRYIRLRDEMVENLYKEALNYDAKKRTSKHMNDKNWQPSSPAGKARFQANQSILEFCRNYKNEHACKDEKILSKGDIRDKVVDILDEKQWAERLGDVDPYIKPAAQEEQQKVINEIKDCVAGILTAKYSQKFIQKEELTENIACDMFDISAERMQTTKAFQSVLNAQKGSDAWEKAMNLKKLAEKDNGAKLIEAYTNAALEAKRAKKAELEAPKGRKAINEPKKKPAKGMG